MKNKILIIIFFIVITIFSACENPQKTKYMPENFPNTKWVSENPNIYFEVNDNNICNGMMVTNNENTKIQISFSQNYNVDILTPCINENGDIIYECMLSARGFFEKEKMIITMTENQQNIDKLFNGKYDKITFVRQDLDQETSES